MDNLLKNNPILMREYNYAKNEKENLDSITVGTSKKVWWKCSLGHEWVASVGSRSKGAGCPYCTNHKVWNGYNDLATVNPQLSREWNYNKNGNLEPTDVTVGSHKNVWWKCEKGHEWQAEVKSRTNGNGCPYCSGRFAVKGCNDLMTVNPELCKEWNYEKNGDLEPESFTANSGKKVWWKCSKGHEWLTTISSRNNGGGCPTCSGRRILKGYNDLLTVNPSLAKEWNYERNGDLKPDSCTSNSGKKVWWICSKGHEWQAVIYHRNSGVDCPVCKSERNTSLPEFALVFYLEKNGVEVVHSFKEYGYELDIYIPSQRTAIEFDGFYWHGNKKRKDIEKNHQCKADGIRLFRIREGLPSLNDSSIDIVIQKDHKDLSQAIERIVSEIVGKRIDVDLKRDEISIENLREYIEKENSLLFANPEVAREWNYDKNGKLKPEYFAPNSGKSVWWKCDQGHEWRTTILSRNSGCGCPYCSGRNAIKGETDLLTVNPELAREWLFEKNGRLTPADVLPNSEKRVWWKCKKGHEWQAMVGNRNKGQGCPYCSGRKALKGYNDLQTVSPEVAIGWNSKKK